MKELPILFNGEMILAILEGRKTQTRRVIKPQPPDLSVEDIQVEEFNPTVIRNGEEVEGDAIFGAYDIWGEWGARFPYGKPGTKLWVRETWKPTEGMDTYVRYRADFGREQRDHDLGGKADWEYPWKPSIHMPRWASRITLEVKNVRVERVQDISEEDAEAEGINYYRNKQCTAGWGPCKEPPPTQNGVPLYEKKWAFKDLWNSINEKRGFGWDANPLVWVVEFERVK